MGDRSRSSVAIALLVFLSLNVSIIANCLNHFRIATSSTISLTLAFYSLRKLKLIEQRACGFEEKRQKRSLRKSFKFINFQIQSVDLLCAVIALCERLRLLRIKQKSPRKKRTERIPSRRRSDTHNLTETGASLRSSNRKPFN